MIDYTEFQNEIVQLRRHLHQYPETAFKEFKTTEFIASYLQNAGYSVIKTQPTGCYAFLNAKENALNWRIYIIRRLKKGGHAKIAMRIFTRR